MAMQPIDIAACRAFSERWIRSRQLTSEGPDLLRPTPVLQFQPEAIDTRPVANGRDPCPRCYIRGDLGCAHQRPCEEAERMPDRLDRTGKRVFARHNARCA